MGTNKNFKKICNNNTEVVKEEESGVCRRRNVAEERKRMREWDTILCGRPTDRPIEMQQNFLLQFNLTVRTVWTTCACMCQVSFWFSSSTASSGAILTSRKVQWIDWSVPLTPYRTFWHLLEVKSAKFVRSEFHFVQVWTKTSELCSEWMQSKHY